MTMKRLVISVLMIGLVAWAASDAFAQRGGGGSGGTSRFQYVIKFICGYPGPATDEELAPGVYYTDINIHNPNHDKQHVNFLKKVALDGDKPQLHGLVGSPERVQLGFDEALHINCSDIYKLARRTVETENDIQNTAFINTANFIKGFVVLYTRDKLDVQGVYTVCLPVVPALSCFISSLHMAEGLVKPSPVPAPEVVFRGLPQVGPSGLSLSLEPFSPLAYDGARLMVYNLNGKLLHDSGFVNGTELSWQPLSADGRRLANGVYLYAVAVRDVLGQISYKIGKFVLLR